MTGVRPTGRFVLEYDRPDGRPGWIMDLPNGVTSQGANEALKVAFLGTPQTPQWYLGLINDGGFVALSPADTHLAHAGWGEYAGLYQFRRVAWVPGPANGGVMASAAQAQLQIISNGSVRGAFLADRVETGVRGGVLYATAAAAGGLPVEPGGTVRISYTVRLRPTS